MLALEDVSPSNPFSDHLIHQCTTNFLHRYVILKPTSSYTNFPRILIRTFPLEICRSTFYTYVLYIILITNLFHFIGTGKIFNIPFNLIVVLILTTFGRGYANSIWELQYPHLIDSYKFHSA